MPAPLLRQVVAMLRKLPFKGITRERILLALAHKGYKKKGELEHELRVVYELLQGNKLHKARLKVRELQQLRSWLCASVPLLRDTAVRGLGRSRVWHHVKLGRRHAGQHSPRVCSFRTRERARRSETSTSG